MNGPVQVVGMVGNLLFHCFHKVVSIWLLHGLGKMHCVGICEGSGVCQGVEIIESGVTQHARLEGTKVREGEVCAVAGVD
jgi:hypothetical protein